MVKESKELKRFYEDRFREFEKSQKLGDYTAYDALCEKQKKEMKESRGINDLFEFCAFQKKEQQKEHGGKMKRYELKTTQSQKEIKLHNTIKFHDNENWNIKFDMSCEGFLFTFFINKEGKYILDFLEEENQHWEGDKEMISYISYIFE